MYVPYKCCQKSFEDYYVQQTGHGINYYQGSAFQRGYGFGGIFRSFFRAAAPLLKSGVKTLGKHLWRSGLDVVNDVSRGENLQVAAKRRLKEAGINLTDKAAAKLKTMIGSGRKNRNKKRKQIKKRITSHIAKKRKTRDIFS